MSVTKLQIYKSRGKKQSKKLVSSFASKFLIFVVKVLGGYFVAAHPEDVSSCEWSESKT